MSDFPRWKYALVAIVLVLGIVYALPNAFLPVPAVQITANRNGTVDQALEQKVSDALKQQNIATTGVELKGDHLLASFVNADVQRTAADVIKAALGDDFTVAFNLKSTVPGWLTAIGAKPMPLGLDLQGGVHFLMQVDQNDVIDKQETRYADDIRSLLREKNIRYESVTRNAVRGQGVSIVLKSAEDRTAASNAIVAEYPDLTVQDGPVTGDRFVLNAVVRPDKLRELSLNTIRQNLAHLAQPYQCARRIRADHPAAGRHVASSSNWPACRTPPRPRSCSALPPRWNTVPVGTPQQAIDAVT